MLIFFISIFILGCVNIFFFSLWNGFLFVSIYEALDVLIFFFELFFDFNVDEFWVINSNRSCLCFLSHNFINKIYRLLRELNQGNCLFIIHIRVYHMNQISKARWSIYVTRWILLLSSYTLNYAFWDRSRILRLVMFVISLFFLFQNSKVVFRNDPLLLGYSCFSLWTLLSVFLFLWLIFIQFCFQGYDSKIDVLPAFDA